MAAPKRQRLLRHLRTMPLHWLVRVGLRRTNSPASLPGYLCEICLYVPAIVLVPAPWGGEMGGCRACWRRWLTQRDA